jgi:hypothetical protein
MEIFYKDERDRDFFEVCENIRRKQVGYISCEEIVLKALRREAKSFYLLERSCFNIIWRKKHEKLKNPKTEHKKELYAEIYRRYLNIISMNHEMTILKAAGEIAKQKAPRFYMSKSHARDLYYKLLKKKK